MEKLRFKDENGNKYSSIENKKMKDISIFITKGTTPTTIGFNFETTGINFFKIESFSDSGYVLKNKIKYISDKCNENMKRSKLCENDILFSIAGAIGRVIYIKNEHLPANINQALALIRLDNSEISPLYLKYFLISPFSKKQILNLKSGSAQLNLSLEQINNFKIKLHPFYEQNKIANYFSNLDTVINNKQRQLELMEKYKEDLLDKIFNQKIRFKDENGCDYPEWKKAKLGDYITIFPKSKHPASVGLISGKYNFFTTSNKNLYLNEFDIDGDYLIIGDGGVANFKHYNGKFSISDHCWLAKFENLNNNYVKQFLTYKEKFINDLLFQGTGLRNLSRKLFLNFEFPLIDIKEQEKIANLFSNLDLKINVLKNSIKNLKEFKIDMLEKMF